MKVKNAIRTLTAIIGGSIVLNSMLYTINEKEQAIITQFGKPVRMILGSIDEQTTAMVRENVASYNKAKGTTASVDQGAGLYAKLPWQSVKSMEDRLLCTDTNPEEVLSKDKKKALMDYYTVFRIVDPLQFFQSLKTIPAAKDRLDGIVYSEIYKAVARYKQIDSIRTDNAKLEYLKGFGLDDALSTGESHVETVTVGRDTIFEEILAAVNKKTVKDFGIQVVDVRPKRFDLVPENEQAVYDRMKSERGRIAMRYQSEGEREKLEMTATADKQREVILADAYRKSNQILGKADATALRIYAEGFTHDEKTAPRTDLIGTKVPGYNEDPEFYQFMKSLETLEKTATPGTKVIIGSDDHLFRYMRGEGVKLQEAK